MVGVAHVVGLLFLGGGFALAADQHGSSFDGHRLQLTRAVEELQAHGDFQLCLQPGAKTSDWFPSLPICETGRNIGRSAPYRHRRQDEVKEHEILSAGEPQAEEQSFLATLWEESSEKIVNGIGAMICISIAALAAGLTLGMLGIDPLLLLIKQRASDDPVEREQASKLLPIVKQHHRLLVTLLLMNAVANEALPIFLEALVPPSLAILFSVVFVLFFGEIIPSAIFTGPNQLKIASSLTPLVKAAMFLLYPIAGPIAKLLDILLHDEDDHGNDYNRGELAALIRIQYEERLAAKRKRKQERRQHQHTQQVKLLPQLDHIGPIDFSSTKSFREEHRGSLRAAMSQMTRKSSSKLGRPASSGFSDRETSVGSARSENDANIHNLLEGGKQLSTSIHIDEVTMVEGALSMKVKCAIDVYTPTRRVFSIPDTTLLSESGVVKIHASGFSRIPVYQYFEKKKEYKRAIIGILLTKQLIVINPEENRPITSMPLYTPVCVGPKASLVDLVNMFQTGGKGMVGGHMALVCSKPKVGNNALRAGRPLPEEAGLMGIITLEDVLETILQEQIYDENDKYERNAHLLAKMVIHRWRRYVKKRKSGRSMRLSNEPLQPAMASVVDDAVAANAAEEGRAQTNDNTESTETTSLLGNLFGGSGK